MKRIAKEGRFGMPRAGLAICTALLMGSFLPTAVIANDGAPDDSTKTNGKPLALNQAVSLDEAPPAQPDASHAVLDESLQSVNAPTKAAGHLSTLRPRTIKRPSTQEDKGDRFGTSTESVSWYRSGYGALAIVLLVVGLVAWAVRRWMPAIRISQSDVLRVVARANVTPKHSVALVHLGRRFVMVGIGGDRLSSLCEVSDPDEVAELLGRIGASQVPPVESGFETMLLSETGEYQRAEKNEEAEASPANTKHQRDGTAAGELLHKLRAMQIES